MAQLALPMPEYPYSDRYSGFDRDFIDLMLKMALPVRLSPTAFTLLCYIVRTEDTRRFADAPTFWKGSLADRVGVHRNNFNKHLRLCINHGWLNWYQADDRVMGFAWVLVPLPYQSMLKCSKSFGAEVVQRNVARSVAPDVARSVAPDVARSVAPSSLTLIHNPPPAPVGDSVDEIGWMAEGDQFNSQRLEVDFNGHRHLCGEKKKPSLEDCWTIVTQAIAKAGIIKFESTAAVCREHGLRPSDVLDLVHFWGQNSGGFLKPQGALHFALTTSRRDSSGKLPWNLADCFPPQDPKFVQSVRDRERSSAEAAADLKRQQEEAARLAVRASEKQLLLEWETEFGPILDAMPDTELADILGPDSPVLSQMAQMKLTRDSAVVRPILIRKMAEFFTATKQTKG